MKVWNTRCLEQGENIEKVAHKWAKISKINGKKLCKKVCNGEARNQAIMYTNQQGNTERVGKK